MSHIRLFFRRFLLGASACAWLVPAVAHEGHEGTTVTLTGTLEIKQYDDFTTGRSRAVSILRDHISGQTWELKSGDKALKGHRTGEKVRVTGRAKGNRVAVAAVGGGIETLSVSGETTTGPQKTIVIMANLTDVSLECTVDEVRDMLFTGERTVDGLFQATSYGKISFHGDVVGPYTLPFSTADGCLEEPWAAAAEEAATSAGIDLSQYPRIIYVLPLNQPCEWSGLATLGGYPSRSWIGACYLKDLYAHEMGHNIYLLHASLDDNNDGVNDFEYGDTSDFMGLVPSGWRHVNAPHKDQMDWTPDDKIITPSGNGDFTISALETTPTLAPYPQIVKFLKDAATNDYYYFAYRTLAPNYNDEMDPYFENKVSIHRWRGENTFFIRTLDDGEVFADTSINLQVKNLARTSDTLTLQVSRNCQSAAPWVSSSPSSCGSNTGTTCTYTITVSNSDYQCVDTTWHFWTTAPSGWSVVYDPPSLTLAPGQSGSVQVHIAPPAGAAQGTYTIYAHLEDGVDPNHTEVEHLIYQLGDQQPPTAPSNLSASNSKGTVSLTWTGSTDNVGVAGYRIYRNSLQIGQSTTTSYTDTPGKGSWTYYIKAFDAAGNLSAASNSRSVNIR